MSGKNLLDKIWKLHTVRDLPSGQTQLFIGAHLVHEVTSPQAFQMIRERKLQVKFPKNTFATLDHVIPTDDLSRPFKDELAEEMVAAIENNTKEFGINFFDSSTGKQGVIHIIAPELGITQPGMTIACGDSHTSTHGAFGAIAFGIGTSQVRDVLATQCISIAKPKVRKINISGKLKRGVYAKDIILEIIRKLGVNGGLGYAYEFCGEVIENMAMEERMTICNMAIEGGARVGYINPDQKTFDYLKGKEYAPKEFEKAVEFWKSIASDKDARYDDEVSIDGSKIEPMITWGINPGQAMKITETFPEIDSFPEGQKELVKEAYKYTSFQPGKEAVGTKIDVAFIGSCTNGRISDLEEAAEIVKGKKISSNVRGLVVPGSQKIKEEAEEEGLDKIFIDAGFEWRKPGCSMCLAMNPDKLQGKEVCASSSNRNFKGRQGSSTGITILMSPAMAAAAALEGKLVDVRDCMD